MSDATPSKPVILDGPAIAAAAVNRLAATLTSSDLNVNLLVLDVAEEIEAHINAEVDVLLVGISGQGEITVDDRSLVLAPGQALLIVKGARRSIRPLGGRFAYFSCHRRRPGLRPTRAPRRPERA